MIQFDGGRFENFSSGHYVDFLLFQDGLLKDQDSDGVHWNWMVFQIRLLAVLFHRIG